MKIIAAQMNHETNTFSPVETRLSRFAIGSETPYAGQAVYRAYKGTRSALGAYIDLCEKAGHELVTPIAAIAMPSGPVHQDAYEYITEVICSEVAKGCDAILLDLHGAMATEKFDDGEGELLRRIRRLAPDTPVAVSLDMHANVFPDMVRLATVVAGYQTYPHTDIYETGLRAANTLFRAIAGEVRPTTAWGSRPMIPHIMRQGTSDSPNKEIQARAKAMEDSGEALVASVFTGFPHADVREAGLSAVVVTDGDQEAAQRLCDELLDMAWNRRAEFVYKIEPIQEALSRAQQLADAPGPGPVILLDHFDNCASGGTMDTTTVFKAVLDAGLEDVAAFGIYDPGAVQKAIAAGIGNRVTLSLGGKTAMPSIGVAGSPLEVSGTVKLISMGRFRNRGAMSQGVLKDMGATVVLDTGRVEIVIVSRHTEPSDIESFLSLGIDPQRKKFVLLKSRIHYRAGYAGFAKAIVECTGVGVCTSDYGQLTFKNIRRPIYPLNG